MEIVIYPPHPEDVDEGDTSYSASHTAHSITRAYHWIGTGPTAHAAAQACLDAINARRREIAPGCAPYVLGPIQGQTVTAHQSKAIQP